MYVNITVLQYISVGEKPKKETGKKRKTKIQCGEKKNRNALLVKGYKYIYVFIAKYT